MNECIKVALFCQIVIRIKMESVSDASFFIFFLVCHQLGCVLFAYFKTMDYLCTIKYIL